MTIKIVTGDQMAAIDRRAIEERGIPGLQLMEQAGRSVDSLLWQQYRPERVAIFCGKGNNAGDGFVVARLMAERNVRVDLILLADPAELSGDACANYSRLDNKLITRYRIQSGAEISGILNSCNWIVDAILGTGVRGAVRGLFAEAIEAINASGKPVLAVDVPSGLPGDGSTPEGPVVRANETVTMGLPKVGMVLPPGVGCTGRVTIAPLDFPPDLLADDSLDINLLEERDMREWFPPRDPAGHKGTFGKTLLVAGSPGLTGAALLASRAAARSGAGMVYLALPERIAERLAPVLIEQVSISTPAKDGLYFSIDSISSLEFRVSGMESAAIGPGLGCEPATIDFVHRLLPRIPVPIVVDADGLNALAHAPDVLKSRAHPTILTPHPGEMARLCKRPVKEVLANRIDIASEFSRKWGVIVLLKGHQTVIAEPGGQRYINPTGNTGLAKGGSGDVLTGLIAGFLAQGLSPLHAACAGAFIHGLCADLASTSIPPRAIIPSDIIELLPKSFKHLGL